MKKVLVLENGMDKVLDELCNLALKGQGLLAFQLVKEIEKAIQMVDLPQEPKDKPEEAVVF